MLHKHHHHGKRYQSGKNKGVADYFAVLGIDSFLPPVDGDPKEESDGEDSFGDGGGVDGREATSRTNVNIDIGTHPGEEEGLTTPRNSNLTRRNDGEVQLDDEGANEGSEHKDATASQQPRNNRNKDEDQMHQERFQREIVYLSLSSSAELRDGWNVCSSTNVGMQNNHGESLSVYGNSNSLTLDGGANKVHLAYQRRGALRNDSNGNNRASPIPQPKPSTLSPSAGAMTSPSSPASCMSPTSPSNYYIPGVADVAIHYAKVRPSTVPCYQQQVEQLLIKEQYYQRRMDNISTNSNSINTATNANDTNTKSIPGQIAAQAVASGAAKHITSLARRTTGLLSKSSVASRGKELMGELGFGRNANVADGEENDRSDSLTEQPINPQSTLTRETQQPHHLYDTGKEGSFETGLGAAHFEDAHGDFPLWNSGSDVGAKKQRARREHFFPDTPILKPYKDAGKGDGDMDHMSYDGVVRRSLAEMLPLPDGFDEWVVPDFCSTLFLPTPEFLKQQQSVRDQMQYNSSSRRQPILVDRTHALPSTVARNDNEALSPASLGISSPSSMGVEAMYLSPSSTSRMNDRTDRHGSIDVDTPRSSDDNTSPLASPQFTHSVPDPTYLPTLVSWRAVPISHKNGGYNDVNADDHVYIPILAIRRQQVGEAERFNEDPAIVDIRLAPSDSNRFLSAIIDDDDDDDFNDRDSTPMMQHGAHPNILKKSRWIPCANTNAHSPSPLLKYHPFILIQRNLPNGFVDLPFPARVLDRFPTKNYRGMPFPEEELPLFCYAGGSRLVRDKLRNLPMPRYFGFVVKNERGDSIYGTLCADLLVKRVSVVICRIVQPTLRNFTVSCMSFLEPITSQRKEELDQLSQERRRTSLPHRFSYQRRLSQRDDLFSKCHLVGFDDIVTFENKTICLVGRYPYWTEFRRFLTHLHLLSGSSSDIPLERNISHLLLSVPVPRPGGQCVLVPLSTMNEPMALLMPPLKDLPLVDLTYQMLFSALDVPTVVTIVLGFLCLEQKVRRV